MTVWSLCGKSRWLSTWKLAPPLLFITHWYTDKMADTLQTTFWNTFHLKKRSACWFRWDVGSWRSICQYQCVNIVACNGLCRGGAKPSPDLMLTRLHDAIWRPQNKFNKIHQKYLRMFQYDIYKEVLHIWLNHIPNWLILSRQWHRPLPTYMVAC